MIEETGEDPQKLRTLPGFFPCFERPVAGTGADPAKEPGHGRPHGRRAPLRERRIEPYAETSMRALIRAGSFVALLLRTTALRAVRAAEGVGPYKETEIAAMLR